MPSVPHEFVTVDMRGLKSALIERSRAARVSVSSLVRGYVESGLGKRAAVLPSAAAAVSRSRSTVKLSLRMSADESECLTLGAARAGLSRAAYLADLIVGAPTPATRNERSERLAALVASNAELSTLSRNVRGLSDWIRQGSSRSASDYAMLLDTIAGDVRQHLARAAAVLSDARPRRALASFTAARSQQTGAEQNV